MIDTEIFELLYTYLKERTTNNIRDQLNIDLDYQDALAKECKIFQQYETLNLSKEQFRVIEQWTDSITAKMLLTPRLFFVWECSAVFPC